MASGSIRVGTSGWSYPGWVGSFYPRPTPPSRMLEHYSRQLPAVELHATFRRTPSVQAATRWAAASPEDFRFAPKAQASITHRRDLDGLAGRTTDFLTSLAPLGNRLGPVMYSLPHRQPDLERLDALLEAMGPSAGSPRAVLELGPAWQDPEVIRRLSETGVGLVVVDTDDQDHPPALAEPIGGITYVRLRRTSYDDDGLSWWARELVRAAESGSEVYAFFRHDDDGRAPGYARRLNHQLGQEQP